MTGPLPRLSIIVPVLNEAAFLGDYLGQLQAMRRDGHEVIVVDGGSSDGSLALAQGLADAVLQAPRGRALQMNAGAERARGEVLLFLHADTQLPAGAAESIRRGLAGGAGWGRFDVSISGRHWLLPVIAACMNLRSRYTGIATGDQAIFVDARLFSDLGGFPELALMEDIALSRRLKARCWPVCLRARVLTSGRRWEQVGVLRTVLLMWGLRLAYFCGADPAWLARCYGYAPRRG